MCALIDDVDGGFDDGDFAQAGGVLGGLVVAGEAGKFDLAGLLGFDQRAKGFAFLQGGQVAAMQEHDVEMIGFEVRQGAVDGASDQIGRPGLAGQVLGGIPALGDKDELIAAMADGVADGDFGIDIGGGGVNQVDAAI